MHGRAAPQRVVEAVADLDALHGLDADCGGRQASVEAQARLGVRAEARRAAEGADLDDSAERVAIGRRRVDRGQHARLGFRDPSSRSRSPERGRRRPRRPASVAAATSPTASTRPNTPMPSSPSRPLRDRADGDSCGGLARRGALEHVAHVVELVLHDAGEVGVTGSRQLHLAAAARRDLGELLVGHRPRAHRGAPVGVVAIAHDQRERPAQREPVAHAAEDLDVVLLDALPRAAAVAGLTAGQIGPDRLTVERRARRAGPRRRP